MASAGCFSPDQSARWNGYIPPMSPAANGAGQPSSPAGSNTTKFRRRTLLGSAGALLAGGGYALGTAAAEDAEPGSDATVPFFGRHQAGIATPPQEHLVLAAFDLDAHDANTLRELLLDWSLAASRMTDGQAATESRSDLLGPATPRAASSLTITFGFGETVFHKGSEDRLGLGKHKPDQLSPLPYFRGDALGQDTSGGDLCVQACADDAYIATAAIHTLARAAAGAASLRWTQRGFRGATQAGERDPRNLMGFKDGTANVDASDAAAMRRSVWANDPATPWMTDGTYLVVRRIRMLLDSWDALSLEGQERAIGRAKATGTPLGATSPDQRPNLEATLNGQPTIPQTAHIRLAAPTQGDGPPPLRRSYSFNDDLDKTTGQLDVGLLFISFQRNPTTQFTPIQQRLATNDALSDHLQTTASAVFACPPGAQASGFVGDRLFVSR